MSGPYDQTQIHGQAGGRVGGVQNLTTQSSVQRTGEIQAQSFQQGTTTSRGERTRRHRNEASSSSSSSDRGYKVGVVGGQGVGGSFQQFSTEGQFAQGVVTGGSYAAAGDSFGSVVSGQRRQGRYQKQVIRLPDQQGQVRQVRRRLPTPEPDTLERVYIQRTGNEVVEEITEIPTTPPPRVQERTVVEPAGPPQVIKRTIRVPPRGGGYQQQSGSFVSQVSQPSGQLLGAGSYGNVQQASSGFQQFGGGAAVASTGYGGYGASSAGYGATGAGYGATGAGYGATGAGYGSVGGGYGSVGGGGFGSFGGGYGSQALGPFPGIPPNARCFYV